MIDPWPDMTRATRPGILPLPEKIDPNTPSKLTPIMIGVTSCCHVLRDRREYLIKIKERPINAGSVYVA